MPSTYRLIKPSDFTVQEWAELYYASDLIPVRMGMGAFRTMGEFHRGSRPFRATPAKIEEAAKSCLGKAQMIKDGELGKETEPGEDAKWIAEMQAVAGKLRKIAKGKEKGKEVAHGLQIYP